jgi:hypothetical protein
MKMRKFLSLLVAPLFVVGIAACDVDQTEEGELPDVDVEGGQVPEYDVDAADVDIGTDTAVIEVPDVDIEDPDADGVD